VSFLAAVIHKSVGLS